MDNIWVRPRIHQGASQTADQKTEQKKVENKSQSYYGCSSQKKNPGVSSLFFFFISLENRLFRIQFMSVWNYIIWTKPSTWSWKYFTFCTLCRLAQWAKIRKECNLGKFSFTLSTLSKFNTPSIFSLYCFGLIKGD